MARDFLGDSSCGVAFPPLSSHKHHGNLRGYLWANLKSEWRFVDDWSIVVGPEKQIETTVHLSAYHFTERSVACLRERRSTCMSSMTLTLTK